VTVRCSSVQRGKYSDQVAERFRMPVDRTGEPDACWNLTRPRRSDGYGTVNPGLLWHSF
jgi:hypothetical protein